MTQFRIEFYDMIFDNKPEQLPTRVPFVFQALVINPDTGDFYTCNGCTEQLPNGGRIIFKSCEDGVNFRYKDIVAWRRV